MIHFDEQAAYARWKLWTGPQPIQHCRGNLSFVSSASEIDKKVQNWSWKGERGMAPRSIQDIAPAPQFASLITDIFKDAVKEVMVRYAFPATTRIETEVETGHPRTIDTVDEQEIDVDPLQRKHEEINAAEEEMLQEIPLPGVPQSEAERRSK